MNDKHGTASDDLIEKCTLSDLKDNVIIITKFPNFEQ